MVLLLGVVTWLRGLLLVGRACRGSQAPLPHTAPHTVPRLGLGRAAAGTAGAAAPCKNKRASFAGSVGCGSEGIKASLESQEFLGKSVVLQRLQIGCGRW